MSQNRRFLGQFWKEKKKKRFALTSWKDPWQETNNRNKQWPPSYSAQHKKYLEITLCKPPHYCCPLGAMWLGNGIGDPHLQSCACIRFRRVLDGCDQTGACRGWMQLVFLCVGDELTFNFCKHGWWINILQDTISSRKHHKIIRTWK